MNLAVRAILSVPLIALIDALVLGCAEFVMFSEEGSMSRLTSAGLMFTGAGIVALAAGTICAPIMLLLGRFLPRPKWLVLGGIGALLGPLPLVLFEGLHYIPPPALQAAIGLGLLSGLLWWRFVERHRRDKVSAYA